MSSRAMRLGSTLLLGITALALAGEGGGERLKEATPAAWQEMARKAGLAPEDIERLAKHKLLMTDYAFKQVFSAYLRSPLPIFVTSDSVLNAFHVLYEESILRLEQANARRLPQLLRVIWKNLEAVGTPIPENPPLCGAAKLRAQVIIGTALELTGDQPTKAGPAGPLIEAEAKKVLAARGVEKPAWLGPPDPGFVALDYSRYKPRGFYTGSETLQHYFRAVGWLQSIPFRVAKDEEFLAILMLGHCIGGTLFGRRSVLMEDLDCFFLSFGHCIGVGDDPDLLDAAHEAQNFQGDHDAAWLPDLRKRVMESLTVRGSEINDQIRFAPDNPKQVAEPAFRILSAYRTPDAILFQRTTDVRQFNRPFPTGLEVAAALGSDYARAKLAGPERERLIKTIDQSRPLFAGPSLYFQYLHCLAALLDKPEPDAPAFLSGEVWQAKSCQTALAGWAQLRHTWALQAKQTVHYLGAGDYPPGFVEPEPEFFTRMAALASKAHETLGRAGALSPDLKAIASDIRAGTRLLRTAWAREEGKTTSGRLSQEENRVLDSILTLARHMGYHWSSRDAKPVLETASKLDEIADRIERIGLPDDPLFRRALADTRQDLDKLWQEFGMLCRRLEAVAHKQLRGIALNQEETGFLKEFGKRLAAVMLYGGNSYSHPRDDAPRVVDVYANPNQGGYLEVGICRPRALYVLYPWQGEEVLCLGAVLPYYEFAWPERLTDAEWKALLDSPKRPTIPTWVEPLVGSRGLSVPKLRERD